MTQYTDATTFERCGIQAFGERAADVRVGLGGRGILGIGTGDLIKREGDVANRLGHWAHGVVVRV